MSNNYSVSVNVDLRETAAVMRMTAEGKVFAIAAAATVLFNKAGPTALIADGLHTELTKARDGGRIQRIQLGVHPDAVAAEDHTPGGCWALVTLRSDPLRPQSLATPAGLIEVVSLEATPEGFVPSGMVIHQRENLATLSVAATAAKHNVAIRHAYNLWQDAVESMSPWSRNKFVLAEGEHDPASSKAFQVEKAGRQWRLRQEAERLRGVEALRGKISPEAWAELERVKNAELKKLGAKG